MIEFSSFLSKRFYKWKQFLTTATDRAGRIQYDEDENIYLIYFYDGPEVFWTRIWKSTVPSDIEISDSYPDSENTEDKAEFLTLITFFNQSNIPKTTKGVVGSAAAKGLGGFTPNPNNNPEEPNPDEIVSLYADGEGSLVTRGYAFTDEGSFREDFGGKELISSLIGTASYVISSSQIIGISSSYTSYLDRDCYVRISGSTEWLRVIRVPTDELLTVDKTFDLTLSGTLEKTSWINVYTGSYDGNISVDNSHIILSGSSYIGGATGIEKFADYGPMFAIFRGKQNQRLDGQVSKFGFRDNIDFPDAQAIVCFEGADNSKIKFITSTVSSSNDENTEISDLTLPASLATSLDLTYKINVTPDYCSLSVNDVFLCKHSVHIPGPYCEMNLFANLINVTTASSDTHLAFDSIYFSNQNQLQIASSFTEPVPIIVKEDLHNITGKLTTNSTTSDQIIINYTVPTGKVFYLIGYYISVEGGADANPMKIGRNNISSEPITSGSVDSNIFRIFNVPASMAVPLDVDFGGNPRRLATEGDIVKVTVTPASSVSTTWRVGLDYVLRS
jgi:hypothetical protein